MTSAYLLLATIFHQISTWQLILGAAVFAFIFYLIGRLFIDNEAEADADSTDSPVRSIVATPRPKRIQPAGSGPDEANGPSPFSETVANIPSDSLAASSSPGTAKKSEDPLNPPRPAPMEPAAPLRSDLLPAMAGIGEAVPSVPKEEIRTAIPLTAALKENMPTESPKPPEGAMTESSKPLPAAETKTPEVPAIKPPTEPLKSPEPSKGPATSGLIEATKPSDPIKTAESPQLTELPKAGESSKMEKSTPEKSPILPLSTESKPPPRPRRRRSPI